VSEFWPWFTRPLTEVAGSVALLVGLFLMIPLCLVALWTYYWVRRKIQAMWSGGADCPLEDDNWLDDRLADKHEKHR
jgi:hypothetical protein